MRENKIKILQLSIHVEMSNGLKFGKLCSTARLSDWRLFLKCWWWFHMHDRNVIEDSIQALLNMKEKRKKEVQEEEGRKV